MTFKPAILAIFITAFCAACTERDTATYQLWHERGEAIEISGMSEQDVMKLRDKNPNCEIRQSADGSKRLLFPNDQFEPGGYVFKTLTTPFTVAIDGVVIVVVGILSGGHIH